MLSLHDNRLMSYEVQCETRMIVLRTEHRVSDGPAESVDISFEGVEGYRFKDDAFGNIILELNSVPVERLLNEFGSEISESYRASGSPGLWAANLVSAPEYLRLKGVSGFLLSSSYGLSGWILARNISIAER